MFPARPAAAKLPFDRQIEWVGAMAALGGGLGYVSWAICSVLRPEAGLKRTTFIETGMGLLTAGALSWVISSFL